MHACRSTLEDPTHTGVDTIPVTDRVKNSCVLDRVGPNRVDPYGRPGQPLDEDYCFQDLNSTTSGSYFSRHSDDRIRYTFKSDASYFLESFLGIDHVLKGGFLLEKERYKSFEVDRSFLDYNEVLTYTIGGPSPYTTGGGAVARTVYVPGYPARESNRADGVSAALYLEDQFRPFPNLSIRAGVRIERENVTSPGFAPFDPRQEHRRYTKRYDACVASSPSPTPSVRDRCARSAFRSYHTYENFPSIGNNPLKQIIFDPTNQMQDRTPERFEISNTNLGPRFSVSWDPANDGKTKLFATAGRVYDKTFLDVAIREQGPDSYIYSYKSVRLDVNCVDDDQGNRTCDHVRAVTQLDRDAQIAPASIVQIDRNLKTPYIDEYTAGFSREIAAETALNLTYVRRLFRDQFQDVDLNHNTRDRGRGRECLYNPSGIPFRPADERPDGRPDDCNGGVYLIPVTSGPGVPPLVLHVADGQPDTFIHNPFFNQVLRVGNFNSTDYEAWVLELVRRLHRNWQMEASYVWSRAEGQAEDYLSVVGNDPTIRQDEDGYLAYDQRHVVKVNVVTQIPLWNVRFGTALTWASGTPYSIVRRQVNEDQPVTFGNFSISYQIPRTTYPEHERNDRRSDSYWLVNINLKKDLTVGKTNIETSLEVFNLLNNTFRVVDQVLNGQTLVQRHVGRQIQLGARFSF